ncbi:MAG: DUF350 domain-containing protein [Deltaproteobacteria bacterium]|nr:DUF350 domain-containing protein [Deltaproteobacteria bacterium]
MTPELHGSVPQASALHAAVLLPLTLATALVAAGLLRRWTATRIPGGGAAWTCAAGDMVAAGLIGGAAAAGVGGHDWVQDAIAGLGHALLASVAVGLAAALGARALLGGGFAAALADGNVAAAVVVAGYQVGAAAIASACFVGADFAGVGPALAFFALGQLSMHATATLLRALTPWSEAEAVQEGNVAAALSMAGLAVAVGAVMGHATAGEFDGWSASLRGFGETALLALLLVPVRVLLVQSLVRGPAQQGGDSGSGWSWRGARLDARIHRENSIPAAALEAAAYLATALALRAVVP